MDKYDYVTATIEDEKIRLEKILTYLKEENKLEELPEYQERYNNICKYLTAKSEYYGIEDSIKEDKNKLDELNRVKDEYEVDNILLEDTLLSNFHRDTHNEYRNLLYENIKYEEEKELLYLLFEKQSNYSELVIKRNKLREILDKEKYPNTYNTLISQGVLIEKQSNILDEIYLMENNIKIEEDKLRKIEDSIMTESILKILYEFWIIDSYDVSRVNKSKLFKDNRSLISIKNNIVEENTKEVVKPEVKRENIILPNLKLPGVDEDIFVDIDGKNYIKEEK